MTIFARVDLNRRLSGFLRRRLGDNPTKRFQREFDCSSRTAEDALNGRATAPVFLRALETYGRPLAEFLFTERDGSDPSLVERIDHDAARTFTLALQALRRFCALSADLGIAVGLRAGGGAVPGDGVDGGSAEWNDAGSLAPPPSVDKAHLAAAQMRVRTACARFVSSEKS